MKKVAIFSLIVLIAQALTHKARGQGVFLDPTFGTTGTVKGSYDPFANTEFTGIIIQPDNKIVATGGIEGAAAAIRFLANGSVDSSFGVNGLYRGPDHSWGNAIIIQPDGKILLEGFSEWASAWAALTIRLKNDGTPDSTFGINGIAHTKFRLSTNDDGNAIALQPDGKIIIGGGNATSLCVARLLPNGTLDNTFGDTGVVVTDYLFPGSAKSVHVMSDGRIVAAGTIKPYYYLAALRLLPNGQFDTTFNHTGIAMALAGDTYNSANGGAVLPDGKVVVGGGGTFGSQGYDMTLVCFNADGSLNHSFGDAGVAHVDFDEQDDEVYALTLTPDNKIAAAGYCTTTKQTIGLAQFDLQGKPDSSFGANGKIVTPLSDSISSALCVALQADGKVVAGGAYHNTNSQWILARYRKIPAHVNELLPNTHPLFYPNPATDRIFVAETKRPSSIKVFNLLGQLEPVLYDKTSGTIVTTDLANGYYCFVAYYTNQSPVVQMVLIKH